MNTNYNISQTNVAISDISIDELLNEVLADILVAEEETPSRFATIEMAKKAPAKKKEDDDDDDVEEDDDDDDVVEEEGGDDWDKDFEEFDVPKKGGKVGGKNAKEEDEDDLDLDLDDDFDNFDDQDDENFDDDF
jgi:hypothetical protein